MAIVPTLSPTVGSSQQGPVYQSNAGNTPDAFGASIGQATQGLGNTIDLVGQQGTKIATDMAIESSVRATKVASANAMQAQTNLGFTNLPGGPDGNHGFYSLKGQAAVDALPIYTQALQDQHDQTIKGFGDDQRAVNMYSNQSQMRIAQAQAQASAHSMQQGQVADVNASQARQSSYLDAYSLNYRDPAALQSFQQVTNGEIQTQGKLQGWEPDQIKEATTAALSKGYRAAILTATAQGDITSAATMFSKLSPQMDAATRVTLAQHLEPKLRSANATAWVNANLMPGGAGPADPSAQPSDGTGLSVSAAIRQQEGPGTSIQGANEGIMSATFKQYAKPGESIDNPADRQSVHDRIISDLSDKAGGDPARIAVGYFSGPGNMTAPGEALPYKADKADANGKTTSGYVSDVLGRMSGTGAVMAAASQNNAQRVANATMVHPDFDGAYQKASVQFADDPVQFQAVSGKLKAAEASYNMGVHTQKEALTKTLNDTVAALSDGQDVEVPNVAIDHVFDQPTAAAIHTKLDQATAMGTVYKGVQAMPQADLVAARQKLADGLGAKAAFPTKGPDGLVLDGGTPDQSASINPEGYAQRQQELAHFDAAVAKRQKLISDDPAGYAMALPNSPVAAAFTSAGNDPVKLQAAIELSKSTQRGLGVADSDTRSLPAPQIASLVKTLHTASPDGKDGVDAGAQIDKLSTQFGTAWPGVFKDLVQVGKLDPSYQVLGMMNQPTQAGGRENLQRALSLQTTSKAKFEEAVPEAERSPLRQNLDTQLADFQKTTAFGGTDMFATVVKPAVTTLATYYAGQGIPGDQAAKRATDEIINQKYDVSGSMRVPKGKLADVQAAGSTLLNNMQQSDIAPNNATLRQARNGQWATNPDGQGVTLMAASTNGGFLPVRGKDGNYISMKFNNLPQAGGFVAPDTGLGQY